MTDNQIISSGLNLLAKEPKSKQAIIVFSSDNQRKQFRERLEIYSVDSGVKRGHPLIAPALGDTEVFPDKNHQFITGGPDDGDQKTGGHGTGVCGIALYGNIEQSIKDKRDC